MNNTQRSIFHADAIKHYIEGKEKVVLPQWMAPRTLLYLWLLLCMLSVLVGLAWFTAVPVYASGLALIVDLPAERSANNEMTLVAFLSPEKHNDLRVGQRIFVELEPGKRREQLVAVVEPKIISPHMAQEQFGLSAALLTQPAAIVMTSFESPSALPATTYIGSVYHVDIEIGSRRVVSLLPLFDRMSTGGVGE
jgi:hypothetical protein